MGIIFRQSVKTTLVTFTGAILGALIIGLSARIIPKQQFGFLRALIYQAALVSQFFLLGLNGTLAVYIHRFPSGDPKRGTLIGLSLMLPVAFLAIASIFYYISPHIFMSLLFQRKDIQFVSEYFYWLPLLSLFVIMQLMLEQLLNSQMRIALPTFAREIVLRVFNVGFIIFFATGFCGYPWLVAGTVMSYIPVILILLIAVKKTKGLSFNIQLFVFSKKEIRELADFTFFHSLLTVSFSLIGFLDVLMLARLDKNGLPSVPVYAIAVFIISVLQIPTRAMMTASFPKLAQAYNNGEHESVQDIFSRSALNILIASLGMALVIGFNLPNMVMLLKNGYEPVLPLVLILMIGRIIDMATGMNDHLLVTSNIYRLNFFLNLLLVIFMIALNLLFIPKWGAFGAAWSTTLALIIYNSAKFFIVWIKMKVQPFSPADFLVLASTAVAGCVGYFLYHFANPWIDSMIRSVIILLTYLGMLLWLKPSRDLQEYVHRVRTTKRLF